MPPQEQNENEKLKLLSKLKTNFNFAKFLLILTILPIFILILSSWFDSSGSSEGMMYAFVFLLIIYAMYVLPALCFVLFISIVRSIFLHIKLKKINQPHKLFSFGLVISVSVLILISVVYIKLYSQNVSQNNDIKNNKENSSMVFNIESGEFMSMCESKGGEIYKEGPFLGNPQEYDIYCFSESGNFRLDYPSARKLFEDRMYKQRPISP